jgi:hypothetical protein
MNITPLRYTLCSVGKTPRGERNKSTVHNKSLLPSNWRQGWRAGEAASFISTLTVFQSLRNIGKQMKPNIKGSVKEKIWQLFDNGFGSWRSMFV